MDPRSETNLHQVHPDLARVLRATPQSPQPFVIIQGARTPQAEAAAVAAGKSQTSKSRHLLNPRYGDTALAVDVWPVIAGKVSSAPGREAQVFGQIAAQIIGAGVLQKVKIQWGGADVGAWVDGVVSQFHDWDHFQLDPSEYPA